MKNYYYILDVSPKCSLSKIKKNYRKIDKNGK